MYDLVIIGAGPAGLTASIYASRYKLPHLIIGKLVGGTITLATKVENFPGFNSVSGLELTRKIAEQAKSFGAEIINDTVGKIIKTPDGFTIITEAGKEYESKTIILATGTERKKLGVPGETKYLGRGISYCTTCDAPFFRGKTVVIVGGSDAAVSGAVHTAEFADKVYIVHRRTEFRAEPIWVEMLEANPKIEKVLVNEVKEIVGDENKITGIKLLNPFNNSNDLATDGVFIEIGGVPGTSLMVPLGAELTPEGYVDAKHDMSTNVQGLFAAGDITDEAQVLVQMTTACAQGAIAAASAYKYLKGQKPAQIQGI